MRTDENDSPDEPKEQRSVQSIEIGGRLLLALAEQSTPMTLKDLAAQAGLPASRAHPYLVSFGRLRLIEQDAVTGRYALGAAALQVGLSCLHQLDPLKVATPVAEALALAIDQTVAVAVWANFGPTIVRYIEASQPLHVSMRMGTVMSILGTATGRAFAATLPRHQLEQAMQGAFGDGPRRLDRSDVKDVAQEIQDIQAELRQHGVVRAAGRPIPGVNAFSAAAFDHEGKAVLVITALGHEDNFPADWDSDMARAVRQAAADVSLRLGYRVKTSIGS
ncbi:IclR family transcriptional regulator [Rhodoferax ferrireducens]|uniref:IclR family transcriptional regulator n=1 Tax=Rhodoferax ferrireducens TaxID=192843 RepID=UPI000E0D64C1|nr:IclR family transcriptional regulator [Rhodoferax ferrireducens]